MNRQLTPLATTLLAVGTLSSCMLPRNQAKVMHGTVRGGDVPLYMPGTFDDFFHAGLILPDVGGYVRAEFDVMDIGSDGLLSPSLAGKGPAPQAQIAFPRFLSSHDLSGSAEIRHAMPVSEPPSITTGYASASSNTPDPAPYIARHYGSTRKWASTPFLDDTEAPPRPTAQTERVSSALEKRYSPPPATPAVTAQTAHNNQRWNTSSYLDSTARRRSPLSAVESD